MHDRERNRNTHQLWRRVRQPQHLRSRTTLSREPRACWGQTSSHCSPIHHHLHSPRCCCGVGKSGKLVRHTLAQIYKENRKLGERLFEKCLQKELGEFRKVNVQVCVGSGYHKSYGTDCKKLQCKKLARWKVKVKFVWDVDIILYRNKVQRVKKTVM